MKRKLLVVALASMLLTGPTTASATVVEYSALLFGSQEVPPVATNGGGYVAADIDTSTNTLTWLAAWWNLNAPVSGAHFHGPAAPGANAGIIQGIDHTVNPSSGSASISATNIQHFADGLVYFNVHSDAHPGGELRGQLAPAGSSQNSPFLPHQGDGTRGWRFDDRTGDGAWFDPIVAVGYQFVADAPALFTAVGLPTGITPGPYTVTSLQGSVSVPAGGTHLFSGSGVSSFTITDIIPGVDPNSPIAFPVWLQFSESTVSFTMIPIVIPEPASLTLALLGVVLLLGRRRR